MKFLTTKQKLFLIEKKEITVGTSYMFPRFGFTIYSKPSYAYGQYMDTNPFTKSLDYQRFLVKSIEDGFCKGNFESNPKGEDAYIREDDLRRRDFIEITLLTLITFIPMVIYNWCTGINSNKIQEVKDGEEF